jgi:hypothetical protein
VGFVGLTILPELTVHLVFIENRYSTRLFEQVASHLQSTGWRVSWLVHNRRFAPTTGDVRFLPRPRRTGSAKWAGAEDPAVFDSEIAGRDRMALYFGGGRGHYAHYWRETERAVEELRPDVIFGEATQFYELMTVAAARRRGIPYLFPSTVRYPPGRVGFTLYDSLESCGGCGELLPEDVASDWVARIGQRVVVPSYMSRTPISPVTRAYRAVFDRIQISASWLGGERFATPSPVQRIVRDHIQVGIKRRWELEAVGRGQQGWQSPVVLYALQMQPESTIDVWGYPWRDQAEIVRALGERVRMLGGTLVVKPNPRPRYEISEALCEVVRQNRHIVPLSTTSSMDAVFPAVQAVAGVTGTVLVEAVCAGKAAFAIGAHGMARWPGLRPVHDLSDAMLAVLDEPTIGAGSTREEAVHLVRFLWATSYPGEICDPLNQPERMTVANAMQLAEAFRLAAVSSLDIAGANRAVQARPLGLG